MSAPADGWPVPVPAKGPGAPAQAREPARQHDRSALRIVVADDVAHVRTGIARLLEQAGFVVAAQVATADVLGATVATILPDVVICDIRMPPDGKVAGLVAAEQIVTSHPSVGVLLLSTSLEPPYARRLLAARADGVGYLSKDRVADLDEFIAAVCTVARGGTVFDAGLRGDQRGG